MGEVALEGEQRRAHAGKRRHHRGGPRHALLVEPEVAEVLGPHAPRRRLGSRGIGGVGAGEQRLERGGAIESAGVEMGEAIVLRDGAGERALGGRERRVDGHREGLACTIDEYGQIH